MTLAYFKRYRMEFQLSGFRVPTPNLPFGYHLVGWHPKLAEIHADVKYRSFRHELDSDVFPCLGDAAGCLRLMTEISERKGFLPQSTWLIMYQPAGQIQVDYCGTVQGVRDDAGMGGIQNLGITPQHRGKGLGTSLLYYALAGFKTSGLNRAFLEVTAKNADAVRLYRRLGFRRTKTVYKASEVAYS